MGVHAARHSGQRAIAGYAFMAFDLVTASDIHYIALPETSIWDLRSEVFEELGLGPSERLEHSNLHVGSKRCLTAESVAAIFEEQCAEVDARRVKRRSSLQALVAFHNAYARYVAMFLQFAAGARRTSVVNFTASSWFAGSTFGFIDDKDAGVASSRTPVHIGPMTQYQLELWEAHLRSLAGRLGTLLGVRAKAASDRIYSILDKKDESVILLLADDGTPQEMTSANLFMGYAESVNRDFGRHFFATELCQKGMSLADIQGFLRHQGNHINAQCALGHETHVARMQRLSRACDEIMVRTDIHAVKGLSGANK